MSALEAFVEPPWDEPLDVERELEAIPDSAQVRGMFIAPLAAEAKRLTADTIKTRYLPFQLYPLREHARLLVETCRTQYADRSLRAGLRKLGRAAPLAFIASTLGKVVRGSVQGAHDSCAALAKGYAMSLQPGRAFVSEPEEGQQWLIVTFEDVYHFLDCHHVGAFEGALKHAGVRGRVRLRKHSQSSAEMLLEW
jgi:uncharacterized protein (TIGR02265 family)